MRLLHTSDWHLGRLFHGVHLTEDQAHVLDQFVALAKKEKPDAVIVAGDIFDRAVPPPEAMELLDDVLARLVDQGQAPVILIAGNHDSSVRLSFGSRFFEQSKLYVRGGLEGDGRPVIIPGKNGELAVYTLPYVEPVKTREVFDPEKPMDHQAAMAARINALPRHPSANTLSVIVAHAFAAGGSASDSERPLCVGGTAAVSTDLFSGFSYAALGHLHRPQQMDSGRLNYSGSLLKYSFSEINDHKSVSMVEISRDGKIEIERISLNPRRDLRLVEGELKELLKGPEDGLSREDYLLVHLKDKGAVLDAMGRLREVYPNVLHITRPLLNPVGPGAHSRGDHRRQTETDLFRSFFSQVMGEELTPEEEHVFSGAVDSWLKAQKET